MPLQAELDDGKRWRVCAGRSRLRVRLRWTELEHPLLDPVRDIVYHHRTTRFIGVPVTRGYGVLTRVEGELAWTGTISIEAGRFFSRRVRFVVENGAEDVCDPPRAASIRLVTQPSAALALSFLVAALVTLAWRGAAMLSTLHLNLSYSHAVTGLGGLTLMAIAVKAVHTVTDELRVHGLPFWGMGYLLGRTLGACLLGACLLGVLLPNCVTTVVNETEANIELKLPSAPGRLVLGPDQQITFLGRVDYVGPTVQSSFADEDRFCVVDEYGVGTGGCEPRPRLAALSSRDGWLRGAFSPARLRVGCRLRVYQVLQVEGEPVLSPEVFAKYVRNAFALVPGPTSEGIVVELDARCQARGPARAVVERSAGEGFEAKYELTEPTTYTTIERSSRLVVQSSSSVPLRLRLAAPPLPAAPGSEGAPLVPGPVLTLEVARGQHVSSAVPTPFGSEVDEFSLIIGASRVELGSVSCSREHTEAESYFRLVGLGLADDYSRLLEVSGRSTGAPGWSSRWRELRPDFPIDVPPMLCTVATGTGEVVPGEPTATETELAGIEPPPIPARALKLTLDVAFPRFGDPVVLRLPAEYAAGRIEVVARDDGGAVARGTLDCVLPVLAEGAAYELSPVWIHDASGRQLRRLRELEVGQANGSNVIEATEDAPGRPCRRLHSRWVTELGTDGEGRDGWFPPWVCRPANWSDATCVDVDGAVSKTPDSLVVDIETTRSQSAELVLSEGTARVRDVPSLTCYFQRDTKQRRKTCPVRCQPKLDGPTRESYNRYLGLSCQVSYECVDQGEQC